MVKQPCILIWKENHLEAVHAAPGDAAHAVAACIVGDKVAGYGALATLLGEGGLCGPCRLVQDVATAGANPAQVAGSRGWKHSQVRLAGRCVCPRMK